MTEVAGTKPRRKGGLGPWHTGTRTLQGPGPRLQSGRRFNDSTWFRGVSMLGMRASMYDRVSAHLKGGLVLARGSW